MLVLLHATKRKVYKMKINKLKIPLTYEELTTLYKDVWNVEKVREEFDILSFYKSNVIVKRKKDKQLGTLDYQHSPRFYYNFIIENL